MGVSQFKQNKSEHQHQSVSSKPAEKCADVLLVAEKRHSSSCDTSKITHISLSYEIDDQDEDKTLHPVVKHLRKKLISECNQTTTGAFHVLSVEEQEFFELDVQSMIQNDVPFTRYVWKIEGCKRIKGHLVVFVMHHDTHGPVLINTFPRIKRPNEPNQPPTPSKSRTYKINLNCSNNNNNNMLNVSETSTIEPETSVHRASSVNRKSEIINLPPLPLTPHRSCGRFSHSCAELSKQASEEKVDFKQTDVYIINCLSRDVGEMVESQLIQNLGTPVEKQLIQTST